VFIAPDLGTSIVFFSIWTGIILMAGVRPRHMLYFSISSLLLIPFGMIVAITDYQRERIALFLDPERDPLGSGFNILQAQISIGSGGFFGRGLLHGTQTQFDYLRTQTTDYIFSVLGEELGFVGAMILFSLFIFVLFRGIRAAQISRDTAGRLIATGIVAQIAVQAFINIAVNLHLFPVTGIPLPFISQGGSSLISVFISLGVLQSVLMRHSNRPY
jgi:rod shape determining protein RodA